MTRMILAAAVLVLAAAISVHALLPRYEVNTVGNDLARFDRWTGTLELSRSGDAPWATQVQSLKRPITINQTPNASTEELISAIPADAEAAGGYRQLIEEVLNRKAALEARGIDLGRYIKRIAYEEEGSVLRRIEAFFAEQEADAQEATDNRLSRTDG